MIHFECDYAEGAHPRILERLQQTNLLQTSGYGTDNFSDQARETIRRLCACPDADVNFLVGGTQTNMIVIGAALRPHQGVIAAESGHISVHESGAIEATGHKVLALPGGREGKLTAAQVEAVVAAHRADKHHEHTVQPAMVYISHPTEFGALYSLRELEVLSAVCRQLGLLLFMDGARLGYALAAEANDLTLPDIARLCDVFYIGGTKVGALFGEAVVIPCASLQRDFRYLIKQRGGLLAKGRLLGIQFETLLSEGLYFDISRHAVRMAMRIREAFEARAVDFFTPSFTNQQFPILTEPQVESLSARYAFERWSYTADGHIVTRFCTSWATNTADVDTLVADIIHL